MAIIIASNATILDEDGVSFADPAPGWTDNDTDTGLSSHNITYDGKVCFKFDTVGNVGSFSGRYIQGSALGDRVVIELELYHNALGTYGASDYFQLQVRRNDVVLIVNFASDGVGIHDGASNNEVGVNLVKSNGSAEWQKWVFDCDFTTPASATCDVYLTDSLHTDEKVGVNIDCSYTGAYVNGDIRFAHASGTTSDRIVHVNYIKVGDDFLDQITKGIYILGNAAAIYSANSFLYGNLSFSQNLTWAYIKGNLDLNQGKEIYLFSDMILLQIKDAFLKGGIDAVYTAAKYILGNVSLLNMDRSFLLGNIKTQKAIYTPTLFSIYQRITTALQQVV